MGCGGHCSCSCGTNKSKDPAQKPSRFGAAIVGVLVLGLGVVGVASAFQPEKKETPKPPATAPATTPADGKEPEKKTPSTATPSEADRYVLDHNMKRIDGTEESLKKYEGQVLLIVNVASKCGNTPQYAGLQKLYTDKKDSGLVILGFPANNFRSQEPGTNKDIAEFCTSKYSVTFPMFEKVSVKGDDVHPLYKQLTTAFQEPDWNFAKYLVDRKGNVVAFYKAGTKPDNKDLLAKIDELLAAKK